MLDPHCLAVATGQDLDKELDNFITLDVINAACILTSGGNLKKTVLHYADHQEQAPRNEVNRS